ncbi:MAG: hypothetical protein JXQ96_01755 [Cyclobacteriaceae bacterium]
MPINTTNNGQRISLNSPTVMPAASAFLWNNSMMIHVNCRGYAVAQFMQPEPAKYAHIPSLEAKTFMQPEQPFYAHHPGRFCYVKDEETGQLISAPYEPVRGDLDSFSFSAGKNNIVWEIEKNGISILLKLSLPKDDTLELWSISIANKTSKSRKLSVYPYFPVGYMSWMNQAGAYDPEVFGVICSSISPYQKFQDYEKIKKFKDKTFLIAETEPSSWEVNHAEFEGEGGLHNPSAIQLEELKKGEARYEMPTCALQYRLELKPGQEESYRFLFGPAKDKKQIITIRQKYFGHNKIDGLSAFEHAEREYTKYIEEGKPKIEVSTPDPEFDNFVNTWLPRQIYYHGITNRLSTDPQTRNYLQDNMGVSYIKPELARQAFITALSQQKENGEMPDGVLIHEEAVLKYINQVPHSDHCVWLPICIKAYLDETDDYELLNEQVPFSQGKEKATVSEHINRAMHCLAQNKDHRGLSYIDQGDWNDPMNMVGYKGKGVSGWLSMATSYGLQVWADICQENDDHEQIQTFRKLANEFNDAINTHLWDGNWYARGITDDNVKFGISDDEEGKIFLNTQSWAFLCGCADESKIKAILLAVESQLETPYGVELVAPAYTAMREDVGRLTQKHPGYAENGSVYNHASAFYIYGLYAIGEVDTAFRVLRKMIPGPDIDDIIQRGQLPVFIPNYYRGAMSLFPRTAGRSSQLFNTGTAHWVYRCLIDGLFGLQGSRKGLKIEPQLPAGWNHVKIKRYFRGAELDVSIRSNKGINETVIMVNGEKQNEGLIPNIEKGKCYQVEVNLPSVN